MDQWVKAFTAKPNNLGSSPRTPTVKGENHLLQGVLTSLLMRIYKHIHMHTY